MQTHIANITKTNMTDLLNNENICWYRIGCPPFCAKKTELIAPANIQKRAKIRYNVPMSFALHDKNQRSHQREILDIFKLVWLLLEKLNKWVKEEIKVKNCIVNRV